MGLLGPAFFSMNPAIDFLPTKTPHRKSSSEYVNTPALMVNAVLQYIHAFADLDSREHGGVIYDGFFSCKKRVSWSTFGKNETNTIFYALDCVITAKPVPTL